MLIFAALFLPYDAGAQKHAIGASTACLQIALVGSVILLCMYGFDFYEPQITTRRAHSFSRLVQALGMTMLIVAAARQSLTPAYVDPAAVLIGILLIVPILVASRYLFAELAHRPILAAPAIVWGTGPLAASLIGELRKRPDMGIHVLGVVDYGYQRQTFAGVRNLGSPDLIWTMTECGQVRRIIIAIKERRGFLPVEKLMALKAAGFAVEDGTALYEGLTGRVWLDAFTVSSLLFSRHFQKSTIRRIFNRGLSLLFAAVAILAAWPVMLMIAALVRWDSKGPVIFRQARVGENGRYFTLLKFRSMKVESEATKLFAPATVDDPRCTRIGKWLRRFRLDELPQLFNILKGDMYFVGPRPFVPEQEAVLVEQIPYYRQRWAVRPGTTGWAQVHRGYNASVEDNVEKLSYDLFYIKNMSLGLDLLTMIKTFKIVLLGRGGR
ncbi:MAG: exopolysaccharide biosynthesis polyprenyl glycosylphosphotransferase [Terriglobia bacterium]